MGELFDTDMSTLDQQNTVHGPSDEVVKKPVKYMIYSQEQAFRHMTQRRSDKEQLLYTITDDILFNVWDAFCLSIDQQHREEYLPYLPHVFDLLSSTDDGLDLYDYLVFIEETLPGGFKGDALARRRSSRVVDLLLEYRATIFNEGQENFKNQEECAIDSSVFYPA